MDGKVNRYINQSLYSEISDKYAAQQKNLLQPLQWFECKLTLMLNGQYGRLMGSPYHDMLGIQDKGII